MIQKQTFRLIVLLMMLSTIGLVLTAQTMRPPNIVLILIDDYGWADTGCYGSTFYRTPNIDRLAANGVRFTDAYAAAPVCSPTRASLMTGKSPARLHLTDWLPGRPDRPDQIMSRPIIEQHLALSETTLAEALKQKGYATAHVGKWHLGGAGFEPERQGFDLNISGDHTGTPRSYFYPYENSSGKMPGLETGREGEYLTDRLTDEAVSFIESSKDKPFFLYLAHYTVHIPLKAKADLIAKYQSLSKPDQQHNNAIYAAMIESMDESVGRVVRKLEELKLDDETIVIFTSDNGGLSVREGPNTPSTSNAPLRDGKGFLYEGGLRVPLIISGIGRKGSVNRTPVVSTDLYPTILELSGLKVPRGLDGMSLAGMLRTGRGLNRDAVYFHYPHYSNQGGKPGSAIRQGDWKLIEFAEDGHVELYNLKDDIGEKTDLAARMPAKARALTKSLGLWRISVRAQMMVPNPGYVGTPQ